MHRSHVGYQKWVLAMFLMSTGLKGTASMKAYRDLGITQKTAWFLVQRIRAGISQQHRPALRPRGDRRDVHRRAGEEQALR